MTNERKTEIEKVLTAMRRAANIARKRAAMHGHKVVIWQDGQVKHVDPTPIDFGQPNTDADGIPLPY